MSEFDMKRDFYIEGLSLLAFIGVAMMASDAFPGLRGVVFFLGFAGTWWWAFGQFVEKHDIGVKVFGNGN